jgi:hypothetical protein
LDDARARVVEYNTSERAVPAGESAGEQQHVRPRVDAPDGHHHTRPARDHGDGWRWPVPDRETLAQGIFGSTAGLEDVHFAAIEQRGTPQPYATFTTPLRLTHTRPPGVRRAAIFCTECGITIAAIRTLLEQGDPRAALFGDPDWDLRELATGHWAMLSAPEWPRRCTISSPEQRSSHTTERHRSLSPEYPSTCMTARSRRTVGARRLSVSTTVGE